MLCTAHKAAAIRGTHPSKCFRKHKPSWYQSLACSEEWKQQRQKKRSSVVALSGHLGPLWSTSKLYHRLASCVLQLSLVSRQGRLGSKRWALGEMKHWSESMGAWDVEWKAEETTPWRLFIFSVLWFQTILAYNNQDTRIHEAHSYTSKLKNVFRAFSPSSSGIQSTQNGMRMSKVSPVWRWEDLNNYLFILAHLNNTAVPHLHC